MAKRKTQRTWKTGSEYLIQGSRLKPRRFVLIGRAKINGRETLLLQPVRKARKHP
jgi:hypothetical protein